MIKGFSIEEVSLRLRKDGRITVSTPFRFPDGDALLMIAEPTATGGVRLSDFGHTLMHLSYSMDVDDIMNPGNRNELFSKILLDHGVAFKNGAFYTEVAVKEIGKAVFSLGQALIQVKEQALDELQQIEANIPQSIKNFKASCDKIRQALEELPNV